MDTPVNDDTKARLSKAGGPRLSPEDAQRLRSTFPTLALEPLLEVESEFPLAGVSFTLGSEQDPSGIGVDMEWMTPDFVIQEATQAAPGIQAARLGLVPVGECMRGSAAPYFVDTKDVRLPVVRVPHDAVNTENDTLDESQIERVADSLDQFFERCTIG